MDLPPLDGPTFITDLDSNANLAHLYSFLCEGNVFRVKF